MRWPNKLVADDVAVSSRHCAWREHAPLNNDQRLRNAAEHGDVYAMESLGLQLINQGGSRVVTEEGFRWLEKSADSGNAVAMARLGECVLDDGRRPNASAEGEAWLLESARQGSRHAAVALATRLINGAGLLADPERGRLMLVNAAAEGSQLAHVKLAAYSFSGRGLRQNPDEGLRWLKCVGIREPSQLSIAGYYAYMKSHATPVRGAARALAEEAAMLYHESMRRGNELDAVNLAYVVRRGEATGASYPRLEVLLAPHLRNNRTFALINQALRLARGIDCSMDWNVADILIAKIQEVSAALAWWSSRSEEGDAEGHLVTGWLVRHQLGTDPHRMPISERMALARDGGWAIPQWMNGLAREQLKH